MSAGDLRRAGLRSHDSVSGYVYNSASQAPDLRTVSIRNSSTASL